MKQWMHFSILLHIYAAVIVPEEVAGVVVIGLSIITMISWRKEDGKRKRTTKKSNKKVG